MSTDQVVIGHKNRALFVGDFFVNLALKLIGGTRQTEINANGADIAIYTRGALVEVKGFQYTNMLRVKHYQTDLCFAELRERGFSQAWMLAFRYSKPWRDGHYAPLYKVAKTQHQIQKYIATHLLTCHLIDLRIIDAICKSRQARKAMENGKGRKIEMTPINLSTLELFTNGTSRIEVAKLGLNPKLFRSFRRDVQFRFKKHQFSFSVAGTVQKQSVAAKPVPMFFDDTEQRGILRL